MISVTEAISGRVCYINPEHVISILPHSPGLRHYRSDLQFALSIIACFDHVIFALEDPETIYLNNRFS